MKLAVPEAFRIDAVERHDFAKGHWRAEGGPASTGVKRHVQSCFAAQSFEGEQMVGGSPVFVLKLDADNRPAVFPQEAGELFGNFAVEDL